VFFWNTPWVKATGSRLEGVAVLCVCVCVCVPVSGVSKTSAWGGEEPDVAVGADGSRRTPSELRTVRRLRDIIRQMVEPTQPRGRKRGI